MPKLRTAFVTVDFVNVYLCIYFVYFLIPWLSLGAQSGWHDSPLHLFILITILWSWLGWESVAGPGHRWYLDLELQDPSLTTTPHWDSVRRSIMCRNPLPYWKEKENRQSTFILLENQQLCTPLSVLFSVICFSFIIYILLWIALLYTMSLCFCKGMRVEIYYKPCCKLNNHTCHLILICVFNLCVFVITLNYSGALFFSLGIFFLRNFQCGHLSRDSSLIWTLYKAFNLLSAWLPGSWCWLLFADHTEVIRSLLVQHSEDGSAHKSSESFIQRILMQCSWLQRSIVMFPWPFRCTQQIYWPIFIAAVVG